MEIEIGEYIRCGTEGIRKVTEVIKSAIDFTVREIKDDKGLLIKREYIKKHSKNIIDLIEVGDIVHIKDVLHEDITYIWSEDYLKALKEDIQNGIKLVSIVTHEQFASIEYKVEEDR